MEFAPSSSTASVGRYSGPGAITDRSERDGRSAMKSWQKTGLTVLGTVMAAAAAFLWLFSYAMSTCGPNATLFALSGLGVLALAVAALGMSASRSGTLLSFGAVAVISLYMVFGRTPGC
jgi:hypothetical protein